MPWHNWKDAVSAILEMTGPATVKQRQLAEIAGIDLPDQLPQLVAKARLRSALGEELGLQSIIDQPVTEGQRDLIAGFKDEGGDTFVPCDLQEASAWISHLYLKQRQKHLEGLQLERGDIVKVGMNDTRAEEVSSIGSDGRIYFKGGAGASAWPDSVVLLCRKDDDTDAALKFKREAANQAARRPHASDTSWTTRKHEQLRDFEIRSFITREDIYRLEDVVDAAKDEKPIQMLLQARPEILAGILNGHRRYCLSKIALGIQYVTDFLIADTDSDGIHWGLVELESPRSSVTLSKSNDLEKRARKGVSQIREWRRFIENNIAYAQQEKKAGGLGLIDITSRANGLVIVGRRSRLRENANLVRSPLRDESHIYVHTYDWLVERLKSARSSVRQWHQTDFAC